MMTRNTSRFVLNQNAFNHTLAAMHIWSTPVFGAGQLCAYAAQWFHNLSGFGEYFMALQRHYIFSFEEDKW